MKSFLNPANFSFRTFLLAISLTFFLNLNAQTLTADDLVKCVNFDLNKFDTYVTAKGYLFQSVSKYGEYTYSYLNGNKYISINERLNDDFVKGVLYQTLDSRNYLAIKTRLVQLGYKLDATKKSSNLVFYYVKGKYFIELTSQQDIYTTVYTIIVKILK